MHLTQNVGHMLERMFEKQDRLKIFTNPFSSSRMCNEYNPSLKQHPTYCQSQTTMITILTFEPGDLQFWLDADPSRHADGMTADTLSKFQTEIDKGNKNWRTQLAEVESNVDGNIRYVACLRSLTWHRVKR